MKLRKFFSKIEEGEDLSCVVFGYKYLANRSFRFSIFPLQGIGVIFRIDRMYSSFGELEAGRYVSFIFCLKIKKNG